MKAGDDSGAVIPKAGDLLSPGRSLVAMVPFLQRGLTRVGGKDGLSRWMRTGTGIVSTGVTTIIGVLTLVFLLLPALRPGSGPTEFGASLTDPRLEQGVALADVYARRGLQVPADYSAAERATVGALVSFDVVIEGFQGRTCRLTWSLFEDATDTRVADAALLEQPGWPDGVFTPAGQRDQASGEIWIKLPEQPGTYFVRLELIDPNGQRITSLDSEPFVVTASQRVRPDQPDQPAQPEPGGLPTPSGPGASRPSALAPGDAA